MGISIRLVRDEEFPEMIKLMYRVFPTASISIKSGDRIIVADREGKVVGFVHYACHGKRAVIKGFGVDGNTRGTGVGTTLINEVLQKFEGIGKPVYLKVRALNPALNIYARFGFFQAKEDYGKRILTLVKKADN